MVRWCTDEIAYCANVHPGTSAQEIGNNLSNISSAVRENGGLANMHAGLWVCETALHEYQNTSVFADLIDTLQREQLKVVTCNGFPQVNFHQSVVKQKVYQPTWADQRRLDYTVGLAKLLARCLPEDVNCGTISTLPLGYRLGWNGEQHQQACLHLLRYAKAAQEIALQTGCHIRLCLEMEPGCVLERTEQIVHFFTNDLPTCAKDTGFELELIDRYLGICYDICHQAVMQENISASVGAIRAAGIIIGKVQVSSALEVNFSEAFDQPNSGGNNGTFSSLKKFAEPKYMHQLSTYTKDDEFIFCDDLIEAINDVTFPRCKPWRIHYHLPIQQNEIVDDGHTLSGFTTTQKAIEEFLDTLITFDYAPHIEVETYTWHVLPEFQVNDSEQALIQGLSREREWLINEMRQRDLLC